MPLTSEDGGEEGGEETAGVDGEVKNSKELWNEMFLKEASKGRVWGEAIGGWADRTRTLVHAGGVPSATLHTPLVAQGRADWSQYCPPPLPANGPLGLTCSSLNWSPPKADTHGLMPPVPREMRARPVKARDLHDTWSRTTDTLSAPPHPSFI